MSLHVAYGDKKSYLEPLRTPWQGAEGIIYLCVAPAQSLEQGAFYLDRRPQKKHMAGPFFTEGSFTKNTAEEVDEMMKGLERWSMGDRPSVEEVARAIALRSPLTALARPVDIQRYMGNWYVLASIPTVFERNATNSV